MSQNKQEYSCGGAGGIQQDIRQSRTSARVENLDGFVHRGGEASQGYAPKGLPLQHTQTPAKDQAKGHEFREMGDFSQEPAAWGYRTLRLKGVQQEALDPVAEGLGAFCREQGVAPDESQVQHQQDGAEPQTGF